MWCWPATCTSRSLCRSSPSTLLPIFSTVVVTAPLGDELHDAIRYPGAVSDEPIVAGHHHRVVDGDRLMWSGQSSVRLGKPQRQAEALLRQIRRTYPALRDVKAEHAWIGVAGHTVHGMPQIGEITPGLWLLSGFGGHGLNTTAMGGEMVARAIVEGDRAWQMFSPFALVWAGGAFGRAAQQVSDWSRRSRETSDGCWRAGATAKRRRAEAAKARGRRGVAAGGAGAAAEPVAEPPIAGDRAQPAADRRSDAGRRRRAESRRARSAAGSRRAGRAGRRQEAEARPERSSAARRSRTVAAAQSKATAPPARCGDATAGRRTKARSPAPSRRAKACVSGLRAAP